ncbi:MAG: hypothetical protein M1840_000787 [Geoglossum simile]|nr:MAG: hypothetical protein M1840_000787 [Geoglossum simile]
MASATRLRFVFTSVFLVGSVVAEGRGESFTNNLFSDLAPLLTLFGERFAQQFLSESFTWLDHIVFAMAPLGIITAFVSAIRVGGPNWLKALVGRARENITAAEVDVMSSTSHDVCELWNGTAIVRTVGRPMVRQLIHLDWLKDDIDSFGLFTLDRPAGHLVKEDRRGPFAFLAPKTNTAIRRAKVRATGKLRRSEHGGDGHDSADKAERGISPKFIGLLTENELQPKESRCVDRSQTDQSPTEVAPNISQMDESPTEEAPNISLNLHGERGVLELALYALIGIILQSRVLVYAGFVTFHPFSKTKLGGPRPTTGFSLQAVGTTFLVVGMALCSLVVEQSTEEKRWTAKSPTMKANPSSSGKRPHVLWLQKKNFVGDQRFDSFLLVAKKECDEILTSRRPAKGNNHLSVLAMLGVVLGILGFIAQLEGFRLSNWSITIAQLVAVFLMTILRAVVRRGLTTRPANEKLPDIHEMDWLALKISNNEKFLKNFSDSHNQDQSAPTWTGTHQVTRKMPEGNEDQATVRRANGWAGPTSEEAISVATAIEIVMNKLLSSEPQEKLIWSLNISIGRNKDDSEEQNETPKIELTVTKSDKHPWRANATEIEAALSLWSYHFWKQHDDSKTPTLFPKSGSRDWLRPTESSLARPCQRVLGRDTEALYRDLAWWIGDGIARESRAKDEDQGTGNILRWGFGGLEPESGSSGKSLQNLSRLTAWRGLDADGFCRAERLHPIYRVKRRVPCSNTAALDKVRA